jgi:hypothetical protein
MRDKNLTVKERSIDWTLIYILIRNNPQNLTLVLERTLLAGSNESDNRDDVRLSVGVLGCDNKKSKC